VDDGRKTLFSLRADSERHGYLGHLRRIAPERPPHLQPKFILVLGPSEDQMLRDGAGSEIHLKAWSPGSFAQDVVLLASREVLKSDDVQDIVRTVVLSAQASVSVRELKQGQ